MVLFIVYREFNLCDLETLDSISFKKGTMHLGNELDKCEWRGLSQKERLHFLEDNEYITTCINNIHDIVKSFLIKD